MYNVFLSYTKYTLIEYGTLNENLLISVRLANFKNVSNTI